MRLHFGDVGSVKYPLIAITSRSPQIGCDIPSYESKRYVCLFGFYGLSNFIGFLMINPFLYK